MTASSVKTDWTVDPGELLECAQAIAQNAAQAIIANPAGNLRTLEAEAESLLLGIHPTSASFIGMSRVCLSC